MKFFIALSLFSLLGCNGMNSELRSPFFPNDKILEKPRCQFKVSNNCWQRSLDLIMACVPKVDTEKPTYFSDERYRCSNQSLGGATEVVFRDPVNLENQVSLEGLSFRIYNGLKPCFSFTGHSQGFTIDANLFGTLAVDQLANGDTQVSCFNGESFLLSKDAKERGCFDGEVPIANVIPQVQLTQLKSLRGQSLRGLSFAFLGLGDVASPVFACQDL